MYINKVKIISMFFVGAHLSMYSMIPVKITNKTPWNNGIIVESSVMNSENIIIPESKGMPSVITSGSTHKLVIDSGKYNSAKNVDTSELIQYKEQKYTNVPSQYKMQSVQKLTQRIKEICNERSLDKQVWLDDVAGDKNALIMRLICLNNMPKSAVNQSASNLSVLKIKLPCAEVDARLCFYKDPETNRIKWNISDAEGDVCNSTMDNRSEVYISKTNGKGEFKITIEQQRANRKNEKELLIDIEDKVCAQRITTAEVSRFLPLRNDEDRKINCEDIIAKSQIVDPTKILDAFFEEKENIEKQFKEATHIAEKRELAMRSSDVEEKIRRFLETY